MTHRAVDESGRDLHDDVLADHDGLREPIAEILRPIDSELEILLRVDLIEPVDRRHEQIGAECGRLEAERDVGVGAQPRAGAYPPVADRVPAADLLIPRFELPDEIAFLKPRAEGGLSRGRRLGTLC